jgi:hypothetical protein
MSEKPDGPLSAEDLKALDALHETHPNLWRHIIECGQALLLATEKNGQGWKCKADRSGIGGNDPQDCDWPGCGCDPHADKVIAALQESGKLLAVGATEQCGSNGVPWTASIKATGIAEEIVKHFSEIATSLIASRSGWIDEETGFQPDDAAEKLVAQDLFNVMMGHDSGCLDPEDLDETSCDFHWTESKLNELLRSMVPDVQRWQLDARKFAEQFVLNVGLLLKVKSYEEVVAITEKHFAEALARVEEKFKTERQQQNASTNAPPNS